MATRRGTKRRASSIAIDEALLDAGVEQIRRTGPDGLSVTALATSAKVTTGAFYSRYENTYEMLVDVWLQRCAQPVRNLLEVSKLADQDSDAMLSVLNQRSPEVAAGMALAIVAPRVPELSEVLVPQFRDWFVESGARDSLILVAFGVGACLFDSIIGSPQRDWATPLTWAGGVPKLRKRRTRGQPPALNTEDLLHVDTGDAVRDRLLISAAQVIGRGGLHRATTSRIARAAGYTQASVFDLWSSRDELIGETTGVILSGLSRTAAQFGMAAMAGDAKGAAVGMSQIVGPVYAEASRMRLELVLAAMYEPVVAEPMVASDLAAAEALTQVFGERAPAHLILADAIRAVVLGLTLLQHLTGDVEGVDFEPAFTVLLDQAGL